MEIRGIKRPSEKYLKRFFSYVHKNGRSTIGRLTNKAEISFQKLRGKQVKDVSQFKKCFSPFCHGSIISSSRTSSLSTLPFLSLSNCELQLLELSEFQELKSISLEVAKIHCSQCVIYIPYPQLHPTHTAGQHLVPVLENSTTGTPPSPGLPSGHSWLRPAPCHAAERWNRSAAHVGPHPPPWHCVSHCWAVRLPRPPTSLGPSCKATQPSGGVQIGPISPGP